MDFKHVQELIKTINKSNISELSIEQGDFKITIKQEHTVPATHIPVATAAIAPVPLSTVPVAVPAAITEPVTDKAAQAAVAPNLIVIKSPMIGTFYRSPKQDKPVFVNVGDEVKKGQILCIIEAMKLFNDIECDVPGRIVKVMVEDSSPVEYDQPLFLVDPA